MLDSRAITKIQSIILIAVIVVAALGGVAAYILLGGGEEQSTEPIRIGILADLDFYGKGILQEAILAAEHLNAEGGILRRQVEIVEEDHLSGTDFDPEEVSNALTRLITVDQADFIIGQTAGQSVYVCQGLAAQYEKVYFELLGGEDEFTQRVLNDYDTGKYYFSNIWNVTATYQGITDGLLLFREMTGFNKVGFLGLGRLLMEKLEQFLPENGFDFVYKNTVPLGTMDFSSYFAAAESAGVEIMVPMIVTQQGLAFVKEYADRQSPMVISGVAGETGSPNGCNLTDGKCNYVTVASGAISAGYPLTSKTIPFREAYIDRWNEIPLGGTYNIIRYILSDAIERAGTIETDAVIEALEETRVETAGAREFVFTESHALMMGTNPNDPEANYPFVILFQWQNGEQVPVYPRKIMEEAGATYIYPDWDGPWNK